MTKMKWHQIQARIKTAKEREIPAHISGLPETELTRRERAKEKLSNSPKQPFRRQGAQVLRAICPICREKLFASASASPSKLLRAHRREKHQSKPEKKKRVKKAAQINNQRNPNSGSAANERFTLADAFRKAGIEPKKTS